MNSRRQSSPMLPAAALVGVSLLLLCFALPKCQAGEGKEKSEVGYVGLENIGHDDQGMPLEPEQILEQLKERQSSMSPEEARSHSSDKKALDHFIEMAALDERCQYVNTHEIMEKFKTDQQLGPQMSAYVEYFKAKQIDLCVVSLKRGVKRNVGGLTEEERQDVDSLLSELPQLMAAGDGSMEWDRLRYLAMDKATLIGAVARFMAAKSDSLAENISTPEGERVFIAMYQKIWGLGFCNHVEAMFDTWTENYLELRHRYGVLDLASRFEPETLKWIKATKVCSQIKNTRFALGLTYDELNKKHSTTGSSSKSSKGSCTLPNCFSGPKLPVE